MIDTLMEVSGDGKGSFVERLKELGLTGDFLRDYPIALLVDWGWLRPQFRIVFPAEFSDLPAPQTYSWPPKYPQAQSLIEQVWLNEWRFQAEEEPMWFVHPVFRPGSAAQALFAQNSAALGLVNQPPPLVCADGSPISPYVDYFFPWQAYALIDVIKAADVFPQSKRFLDTPDAQKRAQSLLNLSQKISWKPEKTLNAAQGWAAWVEPMTWLSHYSALKANVEWQNMPPEDYVTLLRRGAEGLATFLKIDVEQLEAAVKEKLLVLANNWQVHADRNDRWISPAYPYVQKEIYLAVHWLCMLTANKLEDYFEKWKQTSQQYEGWAELHAVLPFEYYTDQEYFLRQAPFYLKNFNARLPKKYRFENEDLSLVVKGICRKCRHFNSFLSSFRKLHEQLSSKPQKPGGIDFRNRSPLDYYLLLAIRAETCFRAELIHREKLDGNSSLESYMGQLSIEVGLCSKATECFDSHVKNVRNLRYAPKDFIERIATLERYSDCTSAPIGQAMLCCLAARNYFAHHDYHDKELLSHKDSQFLLGGILLAVLTLLNDQQPRPSDQLEFLSAGKQIN